jgi:hypothetical protein
MGNRKIVRDENLTHEGEKEVGAETVGSRSPVDPICVSPERLQQGIEVLKINRNKWWVSAKDKQKQMVGERFI